MKHIFIYGILFSGTTLACCLAHSETDVNFQNTLTLKTFNFDRQYENGTSPDTHSLSQGLIYRGDWSTKLNEVQLHFNPSIQYAYRLSNDQHTNDMVIPFDPNTKKQAQDQVKYGLGAGVEYQNFRMNIGEITPDSPLTPQVDTHQLRVNYKGLELKYKTPQQNFELGLINRYSPKNEEDYHKLAISKHESDGLYFFQWDGKTPRYHWKFYNGYLTDLINQSYFAFDYQWTKQHTTKLRVFRHNDVGKSKLGEYDNTSVGAMHFIKHGNFTTGIGYQENFGKDGIPKLDNMPIPHMVNWTLGAFTKADEKSYHFVASYDFKDYIKGLKVTYKYIYGDSFQTMNQNDFEQESDVLIQYDLNAWIKNLKFLFLNINYDTKHGKSLDEQRMMLHYTVNF
ncbi:OprD family outer membrane porin [Acinetobacter seifertii]|uniref:OprD family outer membrane porin n=1 Tax=Acinetobacter seifertii TaxID=1530123 RepID=UPI0018DEC960|nr:OprD family outer membrane porin [Acinetobacter seifertii]QPV58274.1 OprD family outer membrane porin [Acinetobacter seifertii]